MSKQPFVSVVVISYNGESTLRVALESLMQQAYPRKSYEVIVVDDGSTDGTANIAKSYSRVRYVGLKKNQGVSAARNAGLKAAKGEIYVAFDDDCIAARTWLVELMKGYTTGNPVGVGGRLVDPHASKGITNRYISACDSNIGPLLNDGTEPSKNVLRRFWRYVTSRVKEQAPPLKKVEVVELYGANGSFRKEVLKKVGGWRTDMSGIEDRDLSRRIRDAYPGRPFYMMPKAVIVHDRGQTLLQYLLRPYKRGPKNLRFYRQSHITPPVFPFPLLFILALGASLVWSPVAALPLALGLPQLLYAWWGVKAIRRHEPMMALFPYIQLAEESMAIVGLARGYVLSVCNSIGLGVLSLLAAFAVVVGWGAGTLYTSPSPLHIIGSAAFLCLIPGYFAWLILGKENRPAVLNLRILGYVVGLSLLVLMVSGLLLNEIYTVLGRMHPLEMQPLVYTIGGVSSFLALSAFLRSPATFRLLITPISLHYSRIASVIAAAILGIALPLLAIAGAVTLNNGGTAGLALLAMGTVAALILLMAFFSRTLKPYYGWLLYSICVSILLGTSMRGWNITGHDVMQEYQVFQLTLTHAAWHMRYYQDAYMACLSITILPTIMQKLTGIGAPYVYKLLFQLIAALLAPVLYCTLNAFVTKRKAMLATVLFITFPAFLTDIMMLNRQEVAFLFLATSLLVGLDKQLPERRKSLLVFLFLVGTVFSHYSTSYVALSSLGIALLLALLWRFIPALFRRQSHATLRKLTSIYHTFVVLAALVVLIAWGTFATQTSNNLSQTVQAIGTNVVREAAGKSLPKAVTAPSSAAHYAAAQVQGRPLSTTEYYPTAVVQAFPIQATTESLLPISPLLAHSHVLVSSLGTLFNLARTVYALLIEGLIVLGLLLAFLLRRLRRRVPLQYYLVGAGTLILIVAQFVLPPASVDYGITRMIQQGLLVFALPMLMAAIWCLRLVRIPAAIAERFVALVLVLFFLVLSGFLSTLTGGYKSVLPLSNKGFYYDAYYTHAEEIAAAQWLDSSTPLGSRVYSDEFMRRKLITYANIFAQPTLVPGAIPVDSYVMLDYGNTTSHQVPAYDDGTLIYYQAPSSFLGTVKNTVYSSTNVTIYK